MSEQVTKGENGFSHHFFITRLVIHYAKIPRRGFFSWDVLPLEWNQFEEICSGWLCETGVCLGG